MKPKIQNTVTIISAILSAIAIYMVWYKMDVPNNPNWLSVEVGVLAALATVLIGWQIFILVNLKRLEKDIHSNVERKIKKEVDTCKVSFNGEIALLRAHHWYNKAIEKRNNIDIFYLALTYYIEALECFNEHPKKYYDDEILDYISDIAELGRIEDWLLEDDRDKYVKVISKTSSDKKNELLKRLLNINTNRPTLPRINVQVVSGHNGEAHKLVFHNTGGCSAYYVRFGFPRESDENSFSIKCDNPNNFDELKGDGRVVAHLTPNDSFNNTAMVRVCMHYYPDDLRTELYFTLKVDFRSNADPEKTLEYENVLNDDICNYPNSLKILKEKISSEAEAERLAEEQARKEKDKGNDAPPAEDNPQTVD